VYDAPKCNRLAEPTDETYGLRNFVTRDPDGNILTFAAPLPTPTQ
jgi:hypothetical protein